MPRIGLVTELSDGVVRLRRPVAADAEWIVDACRDPENQRWLPLLPSPYELEHAEWWLHRADDVWADGSAAPFVIEDVAGGAPLGVIELRIAPPADVGYWLAPEGRGRGAMTRALRLLVDYAFDELGLERVELFTLRDNVRSQEVAERAGFVREGVARDRIESRDGAVHDADAFALVRRR
jgi:RimJ/RimL family protein N-acetyltransferase